MLFLIWFHSACNFWEMFNWISTFIAANIYNQKLMVEDETIRSSRYEKIEAFSECSISLS